MTHTYAIEALVRTPSYIFSELSCGGFRFAPASNDLKGDLLVSREISASTYLEAYTEFGVTLARVQDAVSVVTQCEVHGLLLGSFFIYRCDDNPAHISFFHYGEQRTTTGMVLDKESVADIEKLLDRGRSDADFQRAISYLRQANFGLYPISFLLTLVIAVEALSGSKESKRKCPNCGLESSYPATNHDQLKAILGGELYKELYATGLRNRLMHGEPIEERRAGEVAVKVHERLLHEYLVPEFGLTGVKRIVNPPRNVSYQYRCHFVRNASRPTLLGLIATRASLDYTDEPAGY